MNGAGRAPARLSLLLSLLLLLACVSLCGCRSSGGGSGSAGRNPLDLSEGTITFHEPGERTVRSRRGTRRTLRATVTLTTVKPEPESEVVIRGDRIEARPGGTNRPADQDLAARIFRRSGERSERELSPARFRETWDRLVEAGLLDLPRHPGPDPPADQAWIRVESGGRQWFFTDPDHAPGGSLPRGEAQRVSQAWDTSVFIITQASN